MPPKEKYTDPELREEIKEEVKASDKGGAPGQWSARKAQLMAREYKSRGGDYTSPKKDASQKHLSQWTKEKWQTKEGSANAKRMDGSEKRYLPKKAWERMSEKEKEETEELKRRGAVEGRQFVRNTEVAKEARRKAQEEIERGSEDGVGNVSEDEVGEPKSEEDKVTKAGRKRHANGKAKSKSNNASMEGKTKEIEEEAIVEEEEENEAVKDNKRTQHKRQKRSPSPKKTTTKTTSSSPNHPPPGSATRLPKNGQTVTYRSIHGYTKGEVLEIADEEKEVAGKKVKATKEDVRIVIRGEVNGKGKNPSSEVVVRKAGTVFFE